jgi:multimeric flavodoxin WrbA
MDKDKLIITGIASSPRAHSLSSEILDNVLEYFAKDGADCGLFNVTNRGHNPCIGCGGCDGGKNCVIPDKTSLAYTRLLESDVIVIASPVYFYGVTGQLKCFIDRSQFLWERQKIGWENNKKPVLFFISTAGSEYTDRLFMSSELSIKVFANTIGADFKYKLLVDSTDVVFSERKANIIAEATDIASSIVKDLCEV